MSYTLEELRARFTSPGVPARPVLSEECMQAIAEANDAAPPLTPDQRAEIGAILRTGRRLAQRTATSAGEAA
jgi:hypothetical protein